MTRFILLVGIVVILASLGESIKLARSPWNVTGRTKNAPELRNPEHRITNGERAQPKQFPYQVGLELHMKDGGESWCGGTLLSDRWVLTAAHCTDLITHVVVYLGATDIENENEEGQQRVLVSKKNIIVHKGWSWDTLRNDISLIKLPVKMKLNEYIQPVTLPKMSDNYDNYLGKTVVASGWGRESDHSFNVARYLQYVEVPILDNEKCSLEFDRVVDTMICIDTTGHKSVCNGDSGGPLVYRDGDVNYLVGSTSFGSGMGCELDFPAVFTRTTSYLDWIEMHTGLANKGN